MRKTKHHVSFHQMWRGGVVLTCGAPLADGVFISRGLSFEVAVWGCARPAAAVCYEKAGVDLEGDRRA
jgi:hypothetical protein